MKPISIPDRWDDVTIIPGTVAWANNGGYDREKFSDTNDNGLHDPGEPWFDGVSDYNANKGAQGALDGIYNEEFYDPLLTGYTAERDAGTQILMRAASPSGVATAVQYYPLNIMGGEGSTEASRYSWNWRNCDPTLVAISGFVTVASGSLSGPTVVALHEIINLDPTATWDEACGCATSPQGEQSPRYFVFPAQDPRIPLSAGSSSLIVTKLIGFFLESVRTNGDFTGRFTQVHRTGDSSCSNGGDFVVDCAVPTLPRTWGAVKETYR